jgi:transcriptional regulator with XRE-family HTH domain
LKSIRELSGHSQLSLANASNVAQSRISEIEASDEPVEVRPATVRKLAETLKQPISSLLANPAEAVA